MSYSTEAILFYGFVTDAFSDSADGARDKLVEQSFFGSDGDLTTYVAVKGAHFKVDLGAYRRLDSMPVPENAIELLRAFCERHGIAYPDAGPAWHLAPVRL